MKYAFIFFLIMAGSIFFVQPVSAEDHRIGVGVHYWDVVDDMDFDDVEDSGYSWIVSYQYKPTFFGFEVGVEVADDRPGAMDDRTFSPQVFVIAGETLYGGVGIGFHYADGDASDHFYAMKVGLMFDLIPNIYLDVNANYRFEKWDMDDVEEDVDTDTITLGAGLRVEF